MYCQPASQKIQKYQVLSWVQSANRAVAEITLRNERAQEEEEGQGYVSRFRIEELHWQHTLSR